jgi:tungstate transport system substrate-binding protein
MRRFTAFLLAAALLTTAPASIGQVRVRMATTTSTENSGLLYEILPPFEKMFDAKVDVIAVGTGRALKLGENGDVDVVLVHARTAEDAFVAAGHGVNRRDLMYNDFVIVGPENDPADIKGTKDAAGAFKRIAATKTAFVSRGDDSGTHKKELSIWNVSGSSPSGTWYMESGQGMGPTLQVANEKQGYCLTDRGTYLAFKDKIDLPVLCEGDKHLFNPYGVIAVSPAAHPDANYVYTMALIGWLTSPECQKMIGGYKKFGEALFTPGAY